MLQNFYYFSCFTNILLNFLGSPLVKYIFLLQALLVFILIFTAKEGDLFWVFATFSLFEGQGRVVWGYGIIFRLLFDLLAILMIIKAIIVNKKLLDRKVIPNFLLIAILLHFFWFTLEVFNPMGPSIFAAFATSKYYIFPFFLFFFFILHPFDVSQDSTQKNIFRLILLLCLSSALVIFQNLQGIESISNISPYYLNLFEKYKSFSGRNFRPWGTSYGPGGMTVYFYIMLGFYFLLDHSFFKKKGTLGKAIFSLVKWLSLGMLFFASFISQIRSATLKSLLILIGFIILAFIGSRIKAKKAMSFLLILTILGLISPLVTTDFSSNDFNTQKTMERWSSLATRDILGNRATLGTFVDEFERRVNLPFGYGLGMTQDFLPDFKKRRMEHVEIPRYYFWHLDNLIFSLFLELGLGALIYIFILLGVNISLLSKMLTLLKWEKIEDFKVVSVCFVSVFVMTIFSWAAVSIPFNPESFLFWFWAALGFNTFHKVKNEKNKDLAYN